MTSRARWEMVRGRREALWERIAAAGRPMCLCELTDERPGTLAYVRAANDLGRLVYCGRLERRGLRKVNGRHRDAYGVPAKGGDQ